MPRRTLSAIVLAAIVIPSLAVAQPTERREIKPPVVRVWSVDITGQPDNVPGAYEVIRDRATQPMQRMADFNDGCGGAPNVEWRDCRPNWPDGFSDRSWPVAYVRGATMDIALARFRVRNANLDQATVVGSVDLGNGNTFEFRKAAVPQVGNELVADNLTASGPLPNEVGFLEPMRITWTVIKNGVTFEAGTSDITVYLLYARPMVPLYLTQVDFTTHGARGKSVEQEVVDGVWSMFTPRQLMRRELDPRVGTISHNGVILRYWTTWDLLSKDAQLFRCPGVWDTPTLLRVTIGRCGGWAQFMDDALALHGIAAPMVGVATRPGFPTGPAGSQLMLIKNWSFGTPSGAGDFPYIRTVEIRTSPAGVVTVAAVGPQNEVDDAPGSPGQENPNPPGYFAVGDHAVVLYNGKIYDPSYGTGPFNDIMEWARASIDGYARYRDAVQVMPNGAVRVKRRFEAHRGIP